MRPHSLHLVIILSATLLVPGLALAADLPDLSGAYSAVGSFPGKSNEYKGTVTIKKTDDTYQVTWKIGDGVYIGTGFVMNGHFAVAYTNKKGSFFGCLLYTVKDEGKLLEGKWSIAGANKLGKETLTKK